MISSTDFDYFLQNGYIPNIQPETSFNILLSKFGDKHWIVKEKEFNDLIYGIIKVGFIEFHIYDEKISGISYRPDLSFPKSDFKEVSIPWIYRHRSIASVEKNLNKRKIEYTKYIVQGPLNNFSTAGTDLFGLDEGEHTFIDTIGGVTFLFEGEEKERLEAYQICKYYKRADTIMTT